MRKIAANADPHSIACAAVRVSRIGITEIGAAMGPCSAADLAWHAQPSGTPPRNSGPANEREQDLISQ